VTAGTFLGHVRHLAVLAKTREGILCFEQVVSLSPRMFGLATLLLLCRNGVCAMT